MTSTVDTLIDEMFAALETEEAAIPIFGKIEVAATEYVHTKFKNAVDKITSHLFSKGLIVSSYTTPPATSTAATAPATAHPAEPTTPPASPTPPAKS